jgi:tRNA modification GTPase
MLGVDRAIVTEVPGTTRDTIEEMVSVRGYPVVLTDTGRLSASGAPGRGDHARHSGNAG